jgi:hypothetical protein
MARRLPKPLIPVLVGVSALAFGTLVMTPSFAGMTQPMEPITPATTSVAPTPHPNPTGAPTPSVDEYGDPIFSIPPTKLDPLRDPTRPPGTIGACSACLTFAP